MATELEAFQKTVWDYYQAHGRKLPWRATRDPYKILVSEIMLQQTQVNRALPIYEEFLTRFPTIQSLAQTELSEVIRVWSGLGYNRRAKYLHDAAQCLAGAKTPWTAKDLHSLKGIGPNTAAAIRVYSYDLPDIFIETNIRTVFIHHFFKHKTEVSDKEILELVEATLPKGKRVGPISLHAKGEFTSPGPMRKTAGLSHYREWYWALMDYGTYIKSTAGNAARQSKHYNKQSSFHGSLRQLRGSILRLLAKESLGLDELAQRTGDKRTKEAVESLITDGLVGFSATRYHLA